MSSFSGHTPSSAASISLGPPPTHADPLVNLFLAAVKEYEDNAGKKLITPQGGLLSEFDTADAIFDFLHAREASFKKFRKEGSIPLSGRLRGIVAVVGTLSSGLGEGVGIPFEPGKVIFAAIGESVKAALAVKEDFDAINDAFYTMEHLLRIIQPSAGEDLNASLREPSLKLLAQILKVLGVITKLQQDGRFRTWLKKLAQSKTVSAALDDLRRLATSHHQAVSSVTLATAQKTLALLMDGVKGATQDQDINRRCLASIVQLAQEVYDEILRGSSVTSNEIRDIRGSLEDIHSILLNHVDSSEGSTGIDEICSWLRYQDCSPRINDLLHHRVPSTGAWLLDGEDMAALKSGSKKALWLQGKAGCGKSTLIAGAIKDLRANCSWQDTEPLVLQHFFDATDKSHSRDLDTLLSSLLCQLARFSKKALSALLELRKTHMSGREQPPKATLRDQLGGLLGNLSGHVFIVVDALDEADNSDPIELLEYLKTRPNVRLLLSSRGEVLFHDRLDCLCDRTVIIEEALVKDDIGSVLNVALSSRGLLAKIREVDLVRQALETGAEGSFRWTVLQISALSPISGIPASVRERLKILPRTLSETYKQCLESIDPIERARVRILLTWLLLSYEPLSITDFAQLLSFDYSKLLSPVYEASWQSVPIDTLAYVGSTFVSVLDGEVRFAHASVKDFLLALPSDSYFYVDTELAYASMARTGLAYVSARSSLNRRSHLATNWVHYVDRAGRAHYSELVRDIIATTGRTKGDYDAEGIMTNALLLAAKLGHLQLVDLLHDKGWGINSTGTWRETPVLQDRYTALHEAASRNHRQVVAHLITLGADVQARGCCYEQTPLHLAAEQGHIDIVNLLLNQPGMKIDTCDRYGSTPLHLAIYSGHRHITAILIARGADVGALSETHGTPLHTAGSRGREDIARLLLAQPKVTCDVVNGCGYTPLHIAAREGHAGIVATLLGQGADIHAREGVQNFTPLLHAVRMDYRDVVELLLNQPGLDINIHYDDGLTALHHAVQNDAWQVAELLIERKAKIDARDMLDWTPLHTAVIGEDCSDAVEVLLEGGADVEVRDSDGYTPLHLASKCGYTNHIRTLSKGGANLESRDDQGWSPLYHAVYAVKEDAVRTLLELGADADTRAADGTSPLDTIGRCSWGEESLAKDERIRKMLLDSIRDKPFECIRDMFLRAEATEDAAEAAVSDSESERGGDAEEDSSKGGQSTERDWSSGDGPRVKRRRLMRLE